MIPLRPTRRASSTLEFALVAPLLLAALFGVLDWSWFMYRRMPVTVAAERGARVAAGVPVAQGPEGIAEDAAHAWLDRFGLDAGALVTAELTTEGTEQALVVEVEVPSEPLIGLVGVPATIRCRASADWYGDIGL